MNTPGTFATKEKVLFFPGSTSENATFGAISAAWKSTECGIGDALCSVTRTVWPTRTWITGPGAVVPNAQASYLIPGAMETVEWLMSRRTFATAPAGAAGSVAGNAAWLIASASALAGATPAKLGEATAPCAVEPADGVDIPGIAAVDEADAFEAVAAAWRAS